MTVHYKKAPHYCAHCSSVNLYDERVDTPHPEHPNRSTKMVCPVCGYNWFFVPDEDWDGGLLTREESPLRKLPNYVNVEDSLLHARGRIW